MAVKVADVVAVISLALADEINGAANVLQRRSLCVNAVTADHDDVLVAERVLAFQF